MKELQIPGFTAEASLYRTTSLYKFLPGSHGLGNPTIIPQQFAECWTDTSCPFTFLVGPMICEDKCNEFPGGPAVYESGGYLCGLCFGFRFDIF